MQVGCQNLNNPSAILMHSFILLFINPFPAKLSYLNFHPLEVVGRGSEPQLQVGENYSFLFNLRSNICKC